MQFRSSALLVLIFVFIGNVLFAQYQLERQWGNNVKYSLNSVNKAHSFLLDKLGNCYVLGTTWQIDSTKDILLIKINPSGKEEWVRTFNNEARGDDIPFAMCPDTEGNIWVCGMAKLKPNNADLLVVKFTPDGIPAFSNTYDGKDHLFDCATSIACDSKGVVYVAGYETTNESGINMIVFRCKEDASFGWKRTYSTPEMDIANKLMIDDSSNIYVCGSANIGPHSADILVQKYDPSGEKKWELIYDGILSQSDFGQFILPDDSMNIYVSGYINHSNSRSDIPIIRLKRTGEIAREIYYNGRIAECIAVDLKITHNNIYLTGNCNDYNISSIFSVISCYTKSGKEKFALNAPLDVVFISSAEVDGVPFALGSKITHPESTLMPYIGEVVSDSIAWSFADSTVYGLSHIISTFSDENNIYFLGDDTGEATGSISIFKYSLKKVPVIKTGNGIKKKSK